MSFDFDLELDPKIDFESKEFKDSFIDYVKEKIEFIKEQIYFLSDQIMNDKSLSHLERESIIMQQQELIQSLKIRYEELDNIDETITNLFIRYFSI